MKKTKKQQQGTVEVKRTGLRRPKKFLKTWGDPSWTCRLTPHLSLGMVDEELPVAEQRDTRKSWYLTLTQETDLLQELGPVRRAPPEGKTLLLFEDDVVALAQYLVDGDLVQMSDYGKLVNGPQADHRNVADGTFAREYAELKKRAVRQRARRKRPTSKKQRAR